MEAEQKTTQLKTTQLVGRSGQRGAGPWIELYFEVGEDGIISKAWFETYGCPSMIRCGDWVTKWAVGRTPQSLLVMEAGDLVTVVGGLPLGKEFCASMTVEGIQGGVTAIY